MNQCTLAKMLQFANGTFSLRCLCKAAASLDAERDQMQRVADERAWVLAEGHRRYTSNAVWLVIFLFLLYVIFLWTHAVNLTNWTPNEKSIRKSILSKAQEVEDLKNAIQEWRTALWLGGFSKGRNDKWPNAKNKKTYIYWIGTSCM